MQQMKLDGAPKLNPQTELYINQLLQTGQNNKLINSGFFLHEKILIQKSKQPQRQFVINTYFCFIGNYESMLETFNLFVGFLFTPYFKSVIFKRSPSLV